MKSGQKGFTLIELLVVIAILGTLAGVVVLNVVQFIGKGACEAAKTEFHNVQTAAVAAGYSLGTNSGVNYAAAADYLLTTPKYTWTVTNGVVTWPGTPTAPATWPDPCVL
jgi:prepilin-type N-terminal cleavage/methylation domain-containing protein